ncbi:MAG: hypothetical protein HY319_32510 [Armatimonadetes bacterium]|nr:hypothetical protein [Armatimonadota bacterium]
MSRSAPRSLALHHRLEPPAPPGPATAATPEDRVSLSLISSRPDPARRNVVEQLARLDNIGPEARESITRDLSVLPLHILELLRQDGLMVVGVDPGQTVADTPWIARKTPLQAQLDLARAGNLLEELRERVVARTAVTGLEDDFLKAMADYRIDDVLQEELQAELSSQGLDLQIQLLPEPIPLATLAESHGTWDPSQLDRWAADLVAVNRGGVRLQDGMVIPSRRLVLLPYAYHQGHPVSEAVLKEARSRTYETIEEALGIHEWRQRLVMLAATHVADPAPEVGHYRLALHEVGHAIDHALERELGPSHRSTIDAFFQEDQKLLRQGTNRFLTDRAQLNAREYFAEAVEAFFTVALGDEHDAYKPDNHRRALQERRPQLFAYLERVFTPGGK